MTALIRDGKMVGTPFTGLSGYDLQRLNLAQGEAAQRMLAKARAGVCLSQEDLKDLMAIRAAVATPAPDPLDKLSGLVRQLRDALR